jgi:hypothetical protein
MLCTTSPFQQRRFPESSVARLRAFLPLVPRGRNGATIEHVTDDRTTVTSKSAVMMSVLPFVLGFSTEFVALRASASVVDSLPRLVGAIVHHRRHCQHHNGLARPWADTNRPAHARPAF